MRQQAAGSCVASFHEYAAAACQFLRHFITKVCDSKLSQSALFHSGCRFAWRDDNHTCPGSAAFFNPLEIFM